MFSILVFIISCASIGYCCGITFGFAIEENRPIPMAASIIGFIGLMYLIWR